VDLRELSEEAPRRSPPLLHGATVPAAGTAVEPERRGGAKSPGRLLDWERLSDDCLSSGDRFTLDEQLPQRFGPFVLLRLLGAGGMGKAYLARHSKWAGRLVVKRMYPSFLEDETLLKRFIHEAQVASHVRHTNVAALVAMGKVETEPFFATEYVFGLPVATIVDRVETSVTPPVPLPIALYFSLGILAGVEAIHEARNVDTGEPLHLVHRDVGSRNVLIGIDGKPRLIDLGLGKSALADWQTATNMFAGSPDYMPPEQALGKRVDRRADVYSTAVTIWEILASRKRIREAALPARIARAIEAQPEPLIPFRKDASPRLEAALKAAMAADPDHRTPTVTMLRETIERELADVSPPFDPASASEWIESACATAIAKERRILEEAEDAARGFIEPESGGTQILVAHRTLFSGSNPLGRPAPTEPQAPVVVARTPSATVASPAVGDRARRLLADLVGKTERQRRLQLRVLAASSVIAILLSITVAAKLAVRGPIEVAPLGSVSGDRPRLTSPAPARLPTSEGTVDPPSEDDLDRDPDEKKPAREDPDARLSPVLATKKKELIDRLRDLRRRRFDVAFQKKLTELGSKLSRARSTQSMNDVEQQIARLERSVQ
jgi:eukaryotic-like serine/threonine-protein kinase